MDTADSNSMWSWQLYIFHIFVCSKFIWCTNILCRKRNLCGYSLQLTIYVLAGSYIFLWIESTCSNIEMYHKLRSPLHRHKKRNHYPVLPLFFFLHPHPPLLPMTVSHRGIVAPQISRCSLSSSLILIFVLPSSCSISQPPWFWYSKGQPGWLGCSKDTSICPSIAPERA